MSRSSVAAAMSPATLEQLFPSLPFVPASPAPSRASFEDGCAICLGRFEKGQAVRTLHCGHRFHADKDCFDGWMKKQNVHAEADRIHNAITLEFAPCPTCRAPLTKEVPLPPTVIGKAAVMDYLAEKHELQFGMPRFELAGDTFDASRRRGTAGTDEWIDRILEARERELPEDGTGSRLRGHLVSESPLAAKKGWFGKFINKLSGTKRVI